MAVAVFDTLRTENFSTIGATFESIGPPLSNRWRAFRITNVTDQNLIFSLDGINDQIFVPSFGFVLYDLSANLPPFGVENNLVFPIGTQFFVRYVDEPESGDVYIEGMFIKGE